MKIITGPALRAYFAAHTAPVPGTGHLFRVVKPLHVFKSAVDAEPGYCPRDRAIVNLVIPVGALVRADLNFESAWSDNDSARKMRASCAVVHSVAYRSRHKKGAPSKVVSSFNYDFEYQPGATVKPTFGFDRDNNECASGIHFFLNLNDAINWS